MSKENADRLVTLLQQWWDRAHEVSNFEGYAVRLEEIATIRDEITRLVPALMPEVNHPAIQWAAVIRFSRTWNYPDWPGAMDAAQALAFALSSHTAKDGMSWEDAKEKAEKYCKRNPFPGLNALAKLIKCSTATMKKAIDRSSRLRAVVAEHNAKRKSVPDVPLTDAAADSYKQAREQDPHEAAATEELLQRLLKQAKPSEREKIQNMTPEQQRDLITTWQNDLEKDRRTRGRGRSR
jgi:hypothetical protein